MWAETSFPTEISNLTTIKFQNVLTGYIGGFVGTNIVIYKTTDSGISWSSQPIWQKQVTEFYTMDFDFIDLGNGNLRFFISYDDKLDKFENSTTTTILERDYKNEYNKVKVINNSTVYWLYTGYAGLAYYGGHYAMSVYRSTNGGVNWTSPILDSYSQQLETESIILSDINSSPTDPNKVSVVGYLKYHNENKSRFLYRYSYDNFENNGGADGFLMSGNDYESFDKVSYRPDGQIIFLGSLGVTKLNLPSNYPELIYNTQVSNPNFVSENGLAFVDNNTGYIALIDGQMLKTTNGGYNWSLDGTIPAQGGNHPPGIVSLGQVVYYATQFQKKMYSRKLGVNFNIKTDQVNLASGTLNCNGTAYSVPSFENLRGGGLYMEASSQLNDKMFYKWNDNSFTLNPLVKLDYDGKQIEAYYKTKKYSNSGTAINNSVQRRSFRDRFGKVNTIHESMGGIFFTKSNDNGSTFITEEVVNDNPHEYNSYATDNNINSFISEDLRPDAIQGQGPEVQSPEKTSVICWERRDGNTIKVKVAHRRKEDIPPPNVYHYWKTDDNLSFDIPNITDPNYKAFPKVFSSICGFTYIPTQQGDTLYKHFTAIVYSKPDVSGSKVMIKCRYEASTPVLEDEFEIASGNISDVSVVATNPYQSYLTSYLDLHITYKKDNKIYYRKETVQYCPVGQTGAICHDPDLNPFEVSSTDGLNSRWTPDISMRNGKPVIIYRGARTVNHIINWDNPGEETPDVMEINKNPIYVRKQNSFGQWLGFQIYDSPGTSSQENPDIEASVDANAHVLSFSRNNTTFYKFVDIDGLSGYHCEPPTFSGNDAKFVAGSYKGQTGSTSHPMLWTSALQGSLYKIDKQAFSITNQNSSPVEYDNLAGIIGMDGVDYRFTLGPIFVRNTFEPQKGVYIHTTTPAEFNENMVTSPFYLDNGDTLILGAQGSYLYAEEDGVFSTIRYDVNLVRKSDDSVERLLFSDTVHAEDSVESIYLRGYVIENLGEADSFYVQVVVNENDLNNGDYTLNGVYMGDNNDDDNSGYKTMVYFEGDGPHNNSVFIPKEYALNQNYPNPFNPSTTISYDIPKDGLVKIKIYDITGREIKTLVNELKTAGRYAVSFNGGNIASGIYFYRIEAGDFIQTKRMMLIK